MENTVQTNNEVVFQVVNGVGHILLNRPKALNALSLSMVDEIGKKLAEWEQDSAVTLILIEGAGEKGLCAGGDMRSFYDKRDEDVEEHALNFFSIEYKMNLALHHYPKPILAYMNGIVMGGGVGVSIFASDRVVTERSKLSMPEMNIGFFPDVGGSYFLNQMPGEMGLYLALTAHLFTGADAVYLGAADYYIESAQWNAVKEEVQTLDWSRVEREEAGVKLRELITKYAVDNMPPAPLAEVQEKVDQHFAFDSVAEILASLEQAAQAGDEWAKETAQTLRGKSPISLAVALEQLRRGKSMSIAECFHMEMNMSMHFMHSHDFYEGVRSVLVDKDRNPSWNPATIEDVRREDVDAFFVNPWEGKAHPLEDEQR
ncbi:enoyl-CoA hydratase/isomerase family protein [Aneurinibacillus sp. REN35]|uniref:enoyl-CoA hydratase/isomerase family protein n=1 Tax=Aneurinibacillus sp. REN35 TaxID=3237286 RepID=UPI00352933FF